MHGCREQLRSADRVLARDHVDPLLARRFTGEECSGEEGRDAGEIVRPDRRGDQIRVQERRYRERRLLGAGNGVDTVDLVRCVVMIDAPEHE